MIFLRYYGDFIFSFAIVVMVGTRIVSWIIIANLL